MVGKLKDPVGLELLRVSAVGQWWLCHEILCVRPPLSLCSNSRGTGDEQGECGQLEEEHCACHSERQVGETEGWFQVGRDFIESLPLCPSLFICFKTLCSNGQHAVELHIGSVDICLLDFTKVRASVGYSTK